MKSLQSTVFWKAVRMLRTPVLMLPTCVAYGLACHLTFLGLIPWVNRAIKLRGTINNVKMQLTDERKCFQLFS